MPYRVCAVPKGVVFAPFGFENEYRSLVVIQLSNRFSSPFSASFHCLNHINNYWILKLALLQCDMSAKHLVWQIANRFKFSLLSFTASKKIASAGFRPPCIRCRLGRTFGNAIQAAGTDETGFHTWKAVILLTVTGNDSLRNRKTCVRGGGERGLLPPEPDRF